MEKYWQTVHALLASPLSPWAPLFGALLSEAMRFSAVVTAFLLLAYIFWPPPLLSLLAVLMLLGLLYITISGASLIRSVLWLHNENWDPPHQLLHDGHSIPSLLLISSIIPTFVPTAAGSHKPNLILRLFRESPLATVTPRAIVPSCRLSAGGNQSNDRDLPLSKALEEP